MRRQEASQDQEFPKKFVLLLRNIRHIGAGPAAARKRAERDRQQLMRIVPARIARPGIIKTRIRGQKPFHSNRQQAPFQSSPWNWNRSPAQEISVCDSPARLGCRPCSRRGHMIANARQKGRGLHAGHSAVW
jgi:hypothetical protein